MSQVPRLKSNDWRVVKDYIRRNATCQADVVWMVSECLLGMDYEWGEEAFGLTDGGPYPPTPDPNDHDCSGHIRSVYWLASLWSNEFGFGYIKSKSGGTYILRTTAYGYYRMATKVPDPANARCGDVVCFWGWRNGLWTVVHIALVGRVRDGVRMCQEARGTRYGVVQYPLSSVLARSSHAHLYRFAWLDLGETSGPQPDPIFQHAMYLTRPLMSGADVEHYQGALEEYLSGKSDPFARALAGWLNVNGTYGLTTYWAVRVAQWHLGLPSTGGIDRATAAALDNL